MGSFEKTQDEAENWFWEQMLQGGIYAKITTWNCQQQPDYCRNHVRSLFTKAEIDTAFEGRLDKFPMEKFALGPGDFFVFDPVNAMLMRKLLDPRLSCPYRLAMTLLASHCPRQHEGR